VEPSPLGGVVAVGVFVFSFGRFLAQIFVYRPELWRGDGFRTKMHVFFLATWGYLSVTFAALGWKQLA